MFANLAQERGFVAVDDVSKLIEKRLQSSIDAPTKNDGLLCSVVDVPRCVSSWQGWLHKFSPNQLDWLAFRDLISCAGLIQPCDVLLARESLRGMSQELFMDEQRHLFDALSQEAAKLNRVEIDLSNNNLLPAHLFDELVTDRLHYNWSGEEIKLMKRYLNVRCSGFLDRFDTQVITQPAGTANQVAFASSRPVSAGQVFSFVSSHAHVLMYKNLSTVFKFCFIK